MKKILLSLTLLSLLNSCQTTSETRLYSITDAYVDSLDTYYERYGIFGGNNTITSDGLYSVTPIGRLINVKVMDYYTYEEYDELKNDLLARYKNNKNVNDVYICKLGTIMIDCRN